MKIEQKLQIDVIKGNRIYYAEYGEYIFVADGHTGVYLTASELKIDKSKMMQVKNNQSFDPELYGASCIKAKETNVAYRIKYDNGFAIKLKGIESDVECFVKEKFLKMFDGYNALYIRDKKDPVLVMKYGKPYGIIMPIHILDQTE